MKNKYYVLFRNNKIFIKVNDSTKVIEYPVTNKKQYPYIPFYCFLFDDAETISSVRKFMQSNIPKNFSSLVIKPQVLIIFPDDAIEMEKRLMEEFSLLALNAHKVILGKECSFLTQEKVNYIAISKSCRTMTITYMKDQNIAAEKFIENKHYTIDELKAIILELHEDCAFSMPQVYLNGSELSEYSELGRIVEQKSILENARELTSQLKFIK